MRDRRAVASPELLGSDKEKEWDKDHFPSEIDIYPATDDEGEPQEKFAWELWPVPRPKPKRNYARTPTAVLGQASGLPGPSTIPGTRHCEAKQQAAGQAAPPVVARRTPGIHTFPVAKETVAAPATTTGVGVAMAQTNVAHEWLASWKARRASQPRITTLAVRNLDIYTSKQEFLDEVNSSGFAEKYDFAYLPRNMDDGRGNGYAFLNFKSPDAASTFAAAWHRSTHLSARDESGQIVLLDVCIADLQGLEANLRKWTCAKVKRIKNGDFLPFVLRDAEPASRASGPETPGSAAVAATRHR